MGSPYTSAGHGAGYGSAYTHVTPGRGGGKKKGHHGVLGFAQNLGSDVVSEALGAGPGLVKTAEALGKDIAQGVTLNYGHPGRHEKPHLLKEVVEPIAKATAQTYAPLAHGHVSQFLHHFYEHPLPPLLDVAAVATGGAGALAKTGSKLAEAGRISETSRLAKLSKPAELKLRSPGAIAGDEGAKVLTKPTSRQPLVRARQQAVHKTLGKLPPQTPVLGEVHRYGREAQRVLAREKLKQVHSRELHDYNRAARKLTPEETAAMHLVGRAVDPISYAGFLKRSAKAGETVRGETLTVLRNPEVKRLYEQPTPAMETAIGAARALDKRLTELNVKHGFLTHKAADEALYRHARALTGKTTAELKVQLHGTAREPFYLPDVAVTDGKGLSGLYRPQGAGRGVPKSPVHQSKLVLFKMGQLQLGKETLGPQFLRSVKAAHADDVHQLLLESAVRIPKGAPLPEGYVYLRRRIGKTPEAIPHTEKTLGDFQRSFDTFAVKHGEQPSNVAEHLGYRLVAPEKFVTDVTGEFTRSTSVVRDFLAKPLTVWRALILGARPAFLVNNVVGNHLLYTLKNAGYSGLRGYLDAVKREHGESMVKSLIRDRHVPPALYDRLMREYFPEQVAGTFGGTQTPTQGRAVSALRKVGAGVVPATQAVAESQVRRAGVLAALRSNPEVRRILQKMPKETREFEAAARQALDENPQLSREISNKVNDTLGDYLNMSPFEQNVLRQLAPFYAWYRAIVRITGKLVLDQPGRAALLAKVGQLGAGMANTQLGPIPADMQTLLAQGQPQGGYQKVLQTGGVNPFQTIAQIGQAGASALGGGPGTGAREIGGLLSPFVTGPLEWATGRSLYTGAPLKGNRFSRGLIGGTVAGIGTGLPETRIIQAATHTGQYAPGAKPGIYKRDLRTELLGAAGYPQKKLNLALAHKVAQPRKPSR